MIDLAPTNPYALTIATPLIAAAGSLGYGVEVARQLGLAQRGAAHGLGALITRSTSERPRRSRAGPMVLETPAGLLYRGVEQNGGARVVRERYAATWASWGLPVIVSVTGADAHELAALAESLAQLDGVAGIELPLALNNALTTEAATRLVTLVRAATPLPLIVKLPGQASNVALAAAVVGAGADTLALSDGLPATIPTADGRLEGLLCGPALRPLALRAVAELCATVSVPVIGGGGVTTAADAQALLDAGASAVSLGAALLSDLRTPARILAGLAA